MDRASLTGDRVVVPFNISCPGTCLMCDQGFALPNARRRSPEIGGGRGPCWYTSCTGRCRAARPSSCAFRLATRCRSRCPGPGRRPFVFLWTFSERPGRRSNTLARPRAAHRCAWPWADRETWPAGLPSTAATVIGSIRARAFGKRGLAWGRGARLGEHEDDLADVIRGMTEAAARTRLSTRLGWKPMERNRRSSCRR